MVAYGFPGLGERLEHLLLEFLVHPDPVVADEEKDFRGGLFLLEENGACLGLSPGVIVLDRVRKEVDEHAPEQGLVRVKVFGKGQKERRKVEDDAFFGG